MNNNSTYSWSKYGTQITEAVLPWIAFACLALLILFLAVLIRCFRYMCCKERIKERGELIKNVFVCISFLVTMLGIGCCAFIIYYADVAYQSYQQLQCGAGRIPYGLSSGDMSQNWIGLELAQTNITDTISFFNGPYQKATNELWPNQDTWIKNATADFYLLLNAYASFANSTVKSPSPYQSTLDLPTNFTQDLGPVTNPFSFAGSIQAEYNASVFPVLALMELLYQGCEAVSRNNASITSSLASSNSQLNTFVSGNQKVNQHVNDWIVNNESNVKNYWRGFTFGIVLWGWFICVGILVTISALVLNIPKLANCLCVFWVCSGLFALLGFLASAALLGTGLVTDNTCGLLNDLFTSSGLYSYSKIIPSNVAGYLDTCFNQGGNMASYINLGNAFQEINLLSTLQSQILNLNVSLALADFQSIQTNQVAIFNALGYVDLQPLNTPSNLTAQYNLMMFNSFTDNNTENSMQTHCLTNFSADNFVFVETDCMNGYSYIDGNNPTQNLGSKSCLVISEWNKASVESRYQGYLTCTYSDDSFPSYINATLSYFESLSAFQTSASALFENLLGTLSQINSTINSTVNQMVSANANITYYFETPMQPVLNSISYLNSGLNCSFVNSYKEVLISSMCTNSLESFYQLFIFIFVLSFLMMVLELLNLYLSTALLKREQDLE